MTMSGRRGIANYLGVQQQDIYEEIQRIVGLGLTEPERADLIRDSVEYVEGVIDHQVSRVDAGLADIAQSEAQRLLLTDQALLSVAEAQADLEAQLERLLLPPWTVAQNVPEYVEIVALLPGAWQSTTVTLPHTGLTIPSLEILL